MLMQRKDKAQAERIAQVIRAEIGKRGVSQREAAEQLGVAQNTLETWVGAKSIPRESARIRIAREWGVSAEDLELDPDLMRFVEGGIQGDGLVGEAGQVFRVLRALASALIDPGIRQETKEEILEALELAPTGLEDAAEAGRSLEEASPGRPKRSVRATAHTADR